MDDRELIEKIRARNRSSYPPVSPAHLHKAEMHLGFSLPPFLKTLYLEVGNGGFGPHNGISGLDGEDGRPWGIPDDVPGEFQATEQIGTWFTICDWGCCNWSVIDCANPERDEMIFLADNQGSPRRYRLPPMDGRLGQRRQPLGAMPRAIARLTPAALLVSV